MKVIIAGSRNIHLNSTQIAEIVNKSTFDITELVCGGAKGIDWAGAIWARRHNIKIKWFRPDWQKYGKAAGPIRNKEMAEYAEGLIAVWNGQSRGTKNMIDEAENLNLKVFIDDGRL